MALLVPVIDHPFFSKIAYYIEDELDKNGYSLLVSSSQSRQSKEYAMIEKLKKKDVDGIIFITHYDYKDEDLSSLPVVSMDRHFDNVPFVTSDNFDSSVKACEWLLAQGCRKVAYIGGKTLVGSEVMERNAPTARSWKRTACPSSSRARLSSTGRNSRSWNRCLKNTAI